MTRRGAEKYAVGTCIRCGGQTSAAMFLCAACQAPYAKKGRAFKPFIAQKKRQAAARKERDHA